MKRNNANQIIYQIYLRTFTAEGTLKAAQKLLPHVKDIGADIIYLAACFKADDDTDTDYWSNRQLASKSNNPKNPYRIADYFSVDSEYGGNDDLAEFIAAAHELKLKVILDMVYFHCGPTAPLIDAHPDFVKRDENGKILPGDWKFPMLNFDSPKLREYLIGNMEYWINEYGADGFRCDAADYVPMDFWQTAIMRIRAIKPDAFMLYEGGNDASIDAGFDTVYGWLGFNPLYRKTLTVAEFIKTVEELNARLGGFNRCLDFFDNHDVASDEGNDRLEKAIGHDGVNSLLAVMFTLGGVPLIYNGNEVADDSDKNMFFNRFCAGHTTVDWQNALSDFGKNRLNLIKTLADIYHSHPEITLSFPHFYNCSDSVLAFTHSLGGKTGLTLANTRATAQSVKLPITAVDPTELLSFGVSYKTDGASLTATLAPFGYLIIGY